MKEIPLTRGYAALVDDRDYLNVSRFNWIAQEVRNAKGKVSIVYAMRFAHRSGQRKKVYMHRCLLRIRRSSVYIDHKDHDGLNNQRHNLRLCSSSQNLINGNGVSCSNTSGYRGVTWFRDRQKWVAQIWKNRRHRTIGYFDRKEDAAKAYLKARDEMFPGFPVK